LVGVFSRLIARHRPRAFLFENVEGFLTAERGDRVLELLEPLVDAGYRIHLRKINAANYGVPQHRKRVIGIGGLGFTPRFPAPTHRAFGAPGSHHVGKVLPTTPTLSAALAGLPLPMSCPPGEPTLHYAAILNGADLARVKALRPGQTMKDIPEELWPPSFKRKTLRRVMDGTPTEKRGGSPAGIRRLNGEEPSKAITSFARSEFVHPSEDRFLTIRECARVQSFPDSFDFLGSAADCALQVANAVPPLLAERIGQSLVEDLLEARDLEPRSGALLSFIPTASEGLSPALERVCDAVRKRFSGAVTSNSEQLAIWR
jgi:DNA (cytosine-5)-methyltransferase 1